jgi:hypothetical protein
MEEWTINKTEFTKAIDWYLRTLSNSNVPVESIDRNGAILRSFYYSIDSHLDELRENRIV